MNRIGSVDKYRHSTVARTLHTHDWSLRTIASNWACFSHRRDLFATSAWHVCAAIVILVASLLAATQDEFRTASQTSRQGDFDPARSTNDTKRWFSNADRANVDQIFQQALLELADRFEQLDRSDLAQRTKAWFIHRDPERLYVFLPSPTDKFADEIGTNDIDREWYEAFLELRKEQGERLFALSLTALERGDAAMAIMLLNEILHEDPDHLEARRILGYRNEEGRWTKGLSQFSSRQIFRAHGRYDWRAGEHWKVNTDHFAISTSHSIEGGEELGRSLERLFSVWEQIFVEFWTDDDFIRRRYESDRHEGLNRIGTGGRKFQVTFFRDRDEYVSSLTADVPGIGASYGYYAPLREESLFYYEESSLENTWFHETTHQIFQESIRTDLDAGEDHGVWALEGIATFIESLEDHGDFVTVGGFDASWLQYARFRAIAQGIFFPLEELSELSKSGLQSHESVQLIYSQSAGLSHFLMTGAEQEYRQAFVEYLEVLYRPGRRRPDALTMLTGVEFEELDDSYQDFLAVDRIDLVEHLLKPADVRHLVLIRSNVDDSSLEILQQASQLEWIDLTATQVTNRGVEHLVNCSQLTQLFLGGTRIDDDGLKSISTIRSIQELDLIGTRITSNGLLHLASLGNLKSLRLSNTSVGDECIDILIPMPNLISVDLRNTRVTEEGLNRLKEACPNLTILGQ